MHETQLVYNQSTRHNWECFAEHRNRMMRLIRKAQAGARGRIAVLGAGNCNDLHLRELVSSFAEVHLFDLDCAAMVDAVARQRPNHASKIRLHSDVDLSGWTSRETASQSQHDRETTWIDGNLDFDLVVSTCVLSQLMETVDRLVVEGVAERELMLQVRDRHLGLMSKMVAPGGSGLVVTDMSSSDSAPDVAECPQARASDLMGAVIRDGSCFTGLSPEAVATALDRASAVNGRIQEQEFSPPWLWQLDEEKRFLVYALSFTKPG